MNAKVLYIAIYRALDCLESEMPNAELSAYLDKANPYVFKDRKSADPLIFLEFEQWMDSVEKEVSETDSFDLAQQYITEQTPFATIFEDISRDEWNSLIEIIKEEEPELL